MSNVSDVFDQFMQGMKDCDDGIKHEAGNGKNYEKGYEYQYNLEQKITQQTIRNEQ